MRGRCNGLSSRCTAANDFERSAESGTKSLVAYALTVRVGLYPTAIIAT